MKKKTLTRSSMSRSYTNKTLKFHTRQENGNEVPTLEGMVVPWEGEPLGYGITESYSEDVFDADIRALEDGAIGIPLRSDHSYSSGLPLGATKSLEKKKDGLWAKFELPTSQADDVKALVDAGVLRGFSIGLTDVEYERSQEEGELPHENVSSATLNHVALLSHIAYPETGDNMKFLSAKGSGNRQEKPEVTKAEFLEAFGVRP